MNEFKISLKINKEKEPQWLLVARYHFFLKKFKILFEKKIDNSFYELRYYDMFKKFWYWKASFDSFEYGVEQLLTKK